MALCLTAIGFRGSGFSSPIRLAEIVFRVKLPQHGNLARSRGRIPGQTSDGLAAPILRGIEFNFPMAGNPEEPNNTDFGQFERHVIILSL